MMTKKLLAILALLVAWLVLAPAWATQALAQDTKAAPAKPADTSDALDEDIIDEGETLDEGQNADEEDDATLDDAQPEAKIDQAKIKAMKLQTQWEDMLHYINIARPQLAASYARAILANPQATPDKIYNLSVKAPQSLRTLRKAENLKPLAKLVPKLRQKIEAGYKAWRADPDQINESLRMMGGTLRGMRLAVQRLKTSGPYALPILLDKLRDPKTPPVLRDRIVIMLPEMGNQALRGYSVALQSTDANMVEFLADALGKMQYPAALPRLREALARPEFQGQNSTAGKALRRAIVACSGSQAALDTPLAELFYNLAQQYYAKSDSLLPDPKNESKTALVWFWKQDLGLEARPVPKEIFCDIYAMRLARLALKYQHGYYPAVPLWLSACLRRQLELPAGAKDNLWPKDQPKAQYYALACSPRYLQMVLARAMRDNNVGIIREAISTLGSTAGTAGLTKPLPSGARPIVDAMSYPDKTVQFQAAEVLAMSGPKKNFAGQEVVMSLLGKAIKQADKGKTARWALSAAEAIRKIGQGGETVYDLRGLVAPLAEALSGDNEKLQSAAAGALAVIDSAAAQQAIVAKALASKASEKIRVVCFDAASESARLFGNRCTDAQIKDLIKLVTSKGSTKLRQAAAKLLGALNLPSEQMPQLILSTDKID
jgi:hypothetical protein